MIPPDGGPRLPFKRVTYFPGIFFFDYERAIDFA
jgi:hypothetical protein